MSENNSRKNIQKLTDIKNTIEKLCTEYNRVADLESMPHIYCDIDNQSNDEWEESEEWDESEEAWSESSEYCSD